MRQLKFISALAAIASCSKRNLDTTPGLHSRAVDSEISTETTASSTTETTTDTMAQLDPWPTNLESLGSPLDIITVTITPTEAATTITASPTVILDSNAALISAQNDYIARRQEDGWKIAVIVICTVGVFIMLTLFIVATRSQHRPARNGSSGGGEEGTRSTFSFGGRRSDNNGEDSSRRAPTPLQRRGRPEKVAEDHKGWELKNLWSTKSSSDPSSGVILDLPPLAVRRTRATTVLSDTDTISPLNPKQHQNRGIQASTTALTDVTVVPSGTQTTIVAPSEDGDDSCTFRASSSPASAAKPAGMSTLAHDNFKDFVFRGTTTAGTAEDGKQNNDASLLADESLYNEQGFYVSPRNPRIQPAPSYQPRNPARVSPSGGDTKLPGAAAGDFVFSNDELEQLHEPRAAKRARRSNDERGTGTPGNTDAPQPRSQRGSAQQQAGNESSIDADRASRASAGPSVLSQSSRAPTPCPGCLVPDRMAPHRHSAEKDDHAAIVASSSRPATATGLHAAQAEAPRPARHRMTLD
ncbi:uncharacterized protein PpBr36_06648 [Pyricularia pennisetigena]|uniref:uncharacterized protein n=1 Tax=Pyricularia pennisetigena TaxID=1578925 RepID=UPI0011549614|nr:uncharacterized protein PpBr36_06648 [Pyricularia pennisetigena]TLS23784.1 hypothetical protein PpBr36_06648 [Pyricularia pennisetigena]